MFEVKPWEAGADLKGLFGKICQVCWLFMEAILSTEHTAPWAMYQPLHLLHFFYKEGTRFGYSGSGTGEVL